MYFDLCCLISNKQSSRSARDCSSCDIWVSLQKERSSTDNSVFVAVSLPARAILAVRLHALLGWHKISIVLSVAMVIAHPASDGYNMPYVHISRQKI